jgi:hypothetical protein
MVAQQPLLVEWRAVTRARSWCCDAWRCTSGDNFGGIVAVTSASILGGNRERAWSHRRYRGEEFTSEGEKYWQKG